MKWLSIIISLIVLSACKKEANPAPSEGKQKFDVYIADKFTQPSGNEKQIQFLWCRGDQFAVFESRQKQLFSYDGETGQTRGTISKVSAQSEPIEAGSSFSDEIQTIYGVFPYVASKGLDSGERLIITLPHKQQYVTDSFRHEAAVMVAASDDRDDSVLHFMNVCGFLIVKVYGTAVNISSVELRGNANEKISGEFIVQAKAGTMPEMNSTQAAMESIVMDCEANGLALDEDLADNAVDLWFVLPPVEFKEGVTLKMNSTEGKEHTVSINKPVKVERNVSRALPPLEFKNSQIKYKVSAGDSASINYSAFDAPVKSHILKGDEWVITFDGVLTRVGYWPFNDHSNITHMYLPDGVDSLEQGVFKAWHNLKQVRLPNTLKRIPEQAFSYSQYLETINLHDSIYHIDAYAFYDCKRLLEISLPRSLTYIGDWAFSGTKMYGNIDVPQTVTYVGNGAFQGTEITSIKLPKNLEFLAAAVLSGTHIRDIEIPEKITSINNYTFSGCRKLESVKLPKGVTYIGVEAFNACVCMETVELSESLKTIDEKAFRLCKELKELKIPKGVESIGPACFEECTKLETVIAYALEPPQISESTFMNTPKNKLLKVPVASVEKYRKSEWNNHFTSIIGIEQKE
ncbi:MAG: leucine-rich repeat domain-containing protein [Bacteroidales bacterium]|nr:leucine-rich repeat domain-containing protein [Bacteroidales bacterium]